MNPLSNFRFLLLLILLLLGRSSAQTDSLPDGFVDVKSIIPTLVLDLRYFTVHNFIGRPIDGYMNPRCVLTRQAAEALAKVQKELLTFSLSLKIYDAYRPQMAVDHFVRWAKAIDDTLTKREFYPTINKKDLFKEGYIATKSSHTRGSTVDLTIVPLPLPEQPHYQSGDSLCECYLSADRRFADNGLDMGSGYDCFHPISHTESEQIGAVQQRHRLLLRLVMEKYGFRNYVKEWWHFTLKNEPFPDTYFDFPIQ